MGPLLSIFLLCANFMNRLKKGLFIPFFPNALNSDYWVPTAVGAASREEKSQQNPFSSKNSKESKADIP